MNPLRRAVVLALGLPAASPVRADAVRRGRLLEFPRDHGAHPGSTIEWWYATGWLGSFDAPSHGFQVTFFRSRTGLAEESQSRFAPRQLLFAHAAVTDLSAKRHHHAELLGRWNGRDHDGSAPTSASVAEADVRIGRWRLFRRGVPGAPAVWQMSLLGELTLDLALARTQPLLLQGEQGFSRKGPDPINASHYYSEPQLAAEARIVIEGREIQGRGRAWLDHEWSDALLHREAVGWDWIGINLADGGALMAFRLRRADGSVLWAGGSHRTGAGSMRTFAADEVQFVPGARSWLSPATHARYPVQWTVTTPAGRFEVNALLDSQELDARRSTGTIYWEGLAELRDSSRRRVGLGYLELTGYGERLRI